MLLFFTWRNSVMQHKAVFLILSAFLACLNLNALAAQAQSACTMDSFTGTYVFYEKGSSAMFPPEAQNASMAPFWAGAFAPFVTIGKVTMKPDGVGTGYFWIRVGSINGGADPIPVEITVTEVNADCTGKFSYSLQLPGNPDPTTVTERFLLFDNGREFRTIPADIVNGVPALTWIGEGHRLSNPDEPLYTCGQQTARGKYVIAVENMVQFTPVMPIFSDVLLLRTNVSRSGDYTGVLYEKLGPNGNIMLPVSGNITVNPDCSYASTLKLTIQGTPVTIGTRGIYFEQGKKFYGLQVSTGGTQFSFGAGERTTD
jgi:hypothetical protein